MVTRNTIFLQNLSDFDKMRVLAIKFSNANEFGGVRWDLSEGHIFFSFLQIVPFRDSLRTWAIFSWVFCNWRRIRWKVLSKWMSFRILWDGFWHRIRNPHSLPCKSLWICKVCRGCRVSLWVGEGLLRIFFWFVVVLLHDLVVIDYFNN